MVSLVQNQAPISRFLYDDFYMPKIDNNSVIIVFEPAGEISQRIFMGPGFGWTYELPQS